MFMFEIGIYINKLYASVKETTLLVISVQI